MSSWLFLGMLSHIWMEVCSRFWYEEWRSKFNFRLSSLILFIRPSSDGPYYGMVMSVHLSVRVSVRISVRQSQFSALFFYMLWHFELKFYMSISSYKHSIKFEFCQFPSIFVGVMPFWNLKYWKYTVFRSFLLHALTYWAGILHMTLFCCTTDQVWVSSISVNFCRSYAPIWTLEYWKYTVFRFSLLHALTYWAEILHMTLFYCTTDQVWV